MPPGPSPSSSLPAAATAPCRRPWRRIALRGALLALLAGGGVEASAVLAGRNLHPVLAGRVYRSGQLRPDELRAVIRTHGIRTVINLRGCCVPFPWYLDECRVTHDLDVAQEDVFFSASRLPPPAEVRRLVEVLDRSEFPVLLHCKQGADRTGLASTLVRLLYTPADLCQARRQLGPRYGHVAIGRTASMDEFFDLYAQWLDRHGCAHSPALLRHWIDREYCPAGCRAELTLPDPPATLPVGRPVALRLRARNTSGTAWQLHPGTGTGTHARFVVCDPTGQFLRVGYSGLFEARVAPGEAIDLTLALPALPAAGRYALYVDLHDGTRCAFAQVGSEPLVTELRAGDSGPKTDPDPGG